MKDDFVLFRKYKKRQIFEILQIFISVMIGKFGSAVQRLFLCVYLKLAKSEVMGRAGPFLVSSPTQKCLGDG